MTESQKRCLPVVLVIQSGTFDIQAVYKRQTSPIVRIIHRANLP